MSDEKELTPEEVLLLAQQALSKGAPVKIRSYVKRSSTGKQVIVREALRGASGGSGRTPIVPPTAQTTPVVSSAAIKSEASAARAGVAQQNKALQAAQKQAAAALKLQKQQNAQKAKQQKQQQAQQKKQAAAQKKAAKPPKAAKTTTPKAPHLGNLGALGALHGGHGGLLRGGGRRGRLFPGSHILARAIGKARPGKKSNNKNSRPASVHVQNIITTAEKREPRVSSAAVSKAKAAQARQAARDQKARETISRIHEAENASHAFGSHEAAAHHALEIAAAYRRSHGHGLHTTGAGFHERVAGEKIVHEGKKVARHLHLSNSEVEENAVALMQEALKFQGFPVEITGEMDMETLTCLEAFLRSEGVDPDVEW